MSRLFGILACSAAAQHCEAEGSCLAEAAKGASQLQVQSSAAVARAQVSEGEAEASQMTEGAGLAAHMSMYLAQGQKLHSAAATVQQAAAQMNASYYPSSTQLNNLINGFNTHVTNSYDACSAQLYQLRQQLAAIHQQVYSLTVEVNSTEYGIYGYEQSCREKTTQIGIIEQTRRQGLARCAAEKASLMKTLNLLKIDLAQMKQIATTHIQILGPSPGAFPTYPVGGGVIGGGVGTGGVVTGGGIHVIGGGVGTGGVVTGGGYGGGVHVIGGGVGTGGVVTGGGYGGGYGGGVHVIGGGGSVIGGGGVIGGGVGGGIGYGAGYGAGAVGGGTHTVTNTVHSTGSSSSTVLGSGYAIPAYNPYRPFGLLETEASVQEPDQNSQGQAAQPDQAAPVSQEAVPEQAQAEAAKPQEQPAQAAQAESREERTSNVQNLVQQAQDLTKRANDCMANAKENPQEAEVFLEVGQNAHEENEANSSTSPVLTSTPLQCREIILQLQHVFTLAYVSLTRLIQEYEMMVSSTACEQAVEQQYHSQITVIQTQANQVCHRVQVFIAHLEQYKIQLTQAVTTQRQLEQSLLVLTQQCGSLTQTSQYLTLVSHTLIALGNCPGLNGTSFSLPTWVGTWVYFSQELGRTDDEIDAAMLDACKQAYPNYGYSVRPAEVAEINQQSVTGMPGANTARSPLIGACPMCEGDQIGNTHGRVCWDAGSNLNSNDKRTDCRLGERAVMCVYEPQIATGFGSGYGTGYTGYTGIGGAGYGTGYTGYTGIGGSVGVGGVGHIGTGYVGGIGTPGYVHPGYGSSYSYTTGTGATGYTAGTGSGSGYTTGTGYGIGAYR